MNSLFTKNTKIALQEYLNACAKVVDIDEESLFNLAVEAIKYYKLNKTDRDILKVFKEAEVLWYKSLEAGDPAFYLYDEPYYLSDVWACWVVYSRKYLLAINHPKSLFDRSIVQDMCDVNIVADLGCGFGYTTGVLKELFPTAKVFGTNLPETVQYKVAKEFGKKYGFFIIPDLTFQRSKKVDLIWASEYFEHIKNPVEHLIELLSYEPKYLIIANAFNAISLGHFNNYTHHHKTLSGKATSKLFNDTLRLYGYEKVKTTLWCERPTYWRRKTDVFMNS